MKNERQRVRVREEKIKSKKEREIVRKKERKSMEKVQREEDLTEKN